jgi:hypothetical protein
MDKLDICISQHGEEAQSYLNQAFLINNETCLLPKFGFPESVFETIAKTLALEEKFGREAYGPPFVVEIKLFAKPAIFTPTSQNIDEAVVKSLYDLRQQKCNYEIDLLDYDEYKNDLESIFKQMQDLNQGQFTEWLKDKFLEDEYYGIYDEEEDEYFPTPETEASLEQRGEYLELILATIIPRLFDKSSDTVLLFPLNDGEQNENFAFVPYFVIGQTCLVFLLVEWIL